MKKALIVSTVAPLLSKPSICSSLSDEGLHGMTVEILEQLADGWFLVNMPYGYTGYMHSENLLFDTKVVDEWNESENYVINGFSVDVLSEPKVQGFLVSNLTRGCIVKKLLDNGEGYTKILLIGNKTGFIRTNYLVKKAIDFDLTKKLTAADEQNFRKNLLKTAQTYLGAPYRWGGKTMWGIDCSGLCQMAYLLNGVSIFRDAKIKNDFPVKEIKEDKLKCGDLIFFPGHVAMYAGYGKYVHSSSANYGVFFNSLLEEDVDYREDLAKSIEAYGSIF